MKICGIRKNTMQMCKNVVEMREIGRKTEVIRIRGNENAYMPSPIIYIYEHIQI